MIARRLLLALLALPALASAQVPWHEGLFLDGGQPWRARVGVTLTNPSAAALAGYPVTLRVGTAAGQLPLVGEQARAVRVCDDAGTELLYDLRGAAGARLSDGPLPAGAALTVPLTAAAGASQRLWVYYDHPGTWLVPDHLRAARGALNGSFESGATAPDEWSLEGSAGGSALSWSTDRPHSGQRCVKCVVQPGTPPTWVAARQRNLLLLPGRRYKLTAWVRGENVQGSVGWYLHVATPDNPMKLGPIVRAPEGTFDWTQVSFEFTAPDDVVGLSHGTVLYGTGTAWFDDVSLSGGDQVEAVTQIAAPERLKLAAQTVQGGVAAGWARALVSVPNPGPARAGVLVQVPLNELRARLRAPYRVDDLLLRGADGVVRAALVLPAQVLFIADLPAATTAAFALDVPQIAAASRPALRWDDLVNHPANLARNPSFEQGDALPAEWPGAPEGGPVPDLQMRRTAGGPVGQWCVETVVPPAAPLRWVGWRQKAPVEAGRSYFFGAQVRTVAVTDGAVTLHGHFHNAAGELTDSKFWSVGGQIAGTTGWQTVSSAVTMGPQTREFELHLTMNARGMLQHDGVLLLPLVAGTLGTTAVGGTDPPLAVWSVDPLLKVFRETPPAATPAALTARCGRGEEETVQLAVRTTADSRLTVAVSPLRQGRTTLPAVRLERVGFVPCLQPSGYFQSQAQPWERQKVAAAGRTDGWRGWWPDYLAPLSGPLEIGAGQTQPVWLTIRVPRDGAAGLFSGEVSVTANGRTVVLPLRVQVWKQQLPVRPSLQAVLDVRNGTGNADLRSQADHERWWRFMAQRRVSCDSVRPDVNVRWVDGQVVLDTAAFDRAAALCYDELQMSGGYLPGNLYACGWAHPPRDICGFKFGQPAWNTAYQAAVRALWAHVKAKGWSDRLSLYVSDEPHYDHPEVVDWLGQVIDQIRAAAPDLPVYSSTWGHVPAWDGRLNHWGIGQYGVFPTAELARRRAAGDKVWFTCDGQMEIDTPYNATERMLPYYCFNHDVSGWEFWGISWYTYDPFQFGWHQFIHQSSAPGESSWVRYPNGDGYLAYPGGPLGLPGPLSTVRLEQAREGIEDYERLLALRRLADRPAAAALLAEVRALTPIPNAGGYRSTDILPDPDKLTNLRDRIGNLLDQLGG
ncbi:MAG: DUF4091 domain-containing protein [Fimbriimonadaceae bacterium]|nr:DUF4091 domain-containing protein [Fimbriimonadaceae bacterium]